MHMRFLPEILYVLIHIEDKSCVDAENVFCCEEPNIFSETKTLVTKGNRILLVRLGGRCKSFILCPEIKTSHFS